MTNEEREKHLDWLYRLKSEIFVFMPEDWIMPFADALDVAIKALEQEPTTKDNSEIIEMLELLKAQARNSGANTFIWDVPLESFNFVITRAVESLAQEPTTKNNLGVDCISRAEMLRYQQYLHGKMSNEENYKLWEFIKKLPSVTPQEPRTGHCKDCKWWKDKDGVYRRGIGAESKCPINRREIMEGMGYCFMFEPQESEVADGNDD